MTRFQHILFSLTLTLAAFLCLSGSDPAVSEVFYQPIYEDDPDGHTYQRPELLTQSGTTDKCTTDLDCATPLVCGEKGRCEVPKSEKGKVCA